MAMLFFFSLSPYICVRVCDCSVLNIAIEKKKQTTKQIDFVFIGLKEEQREKKRKEKKDWVYRIDEV